MIISVVIILYHHAILNSYLLRFCLGGKHKGAKYGMGFNNILLVISTSLVDQHWGLLECTFIDMNQYFSSSNNKICSKESQSKLLTS